MNERRQSFLFINGILNTPEDVNAWTDNAETWIERETRYTAEKFEYRSGVFTRRLFQAARVDKVMQIAKRIDSQNLVLVGHSNGADIIERVVRKNKLQIKELHLIAAASEHNFEKNGYNKALATGAVGKIFVYCSAHDKALMKAKISSFFQFMGLGYGYLGLVGPSRVSEENKDKVVTIWKKFDHGQWFSKANFENTMKKIVHAT